MCNIIYLLFMLCGISYCYGKETTELTCWECNVWKAGFGQLCDDPRQVDDCTVCMKVETTIFMGYYKSTPRTSTIVTRACGKDYTPQFGSECLTYKMVDGWSTRCFCNHDLCNVAHRHTTSYAGFMLLFTFIHTFYRLFL